MKYSESLLAFINKLKEQEIPQASSRALKSIYGEGEAAVYYNEPKDPEDTSEKEKAKLLFKTAKAQLLSLFDEIIKLNPINLYILQQFKNRIDTEFSFENISSEKDRVRILHEIKKNHEHVFLNYAEKIKTIEKSDISHLELTLCYQGAADHLNSFCHMIMSINFESFLIEQKKQIMQQLIKEYLIANHLITIAGNEIHTINAYFNLFEHMHSLKSIDDAFAPQGIAENHRLGCEAFIKNNFKFQYFIDIFNDQFSMPEKIDQAWVDQQLAFFKGSTPDEFWSLGLTENSEVKSLDENTKRRLQQLMFFREIKRFDPNQLNNLVCENKINNEAAIFITPNDMYILKNDIELQPITDNIFNQYKDQIQKNIKDHKLVNYDDACYLKELNQETIIASGFQEKVIILSLLTNNQILNDQSIKYLQSKFGDKVQSDDNALKQKFLDFLIDNLYPEFKHSSTEGTKLFSFINFLCIKGDAKILKALAKLDTEINFDQKNSQNITPLYLAAQRTDVTIVNALVEIFKDKNIQPDITIQYQGTREPIVYFAAKNGHVQLFEEIIKHWDPDINLNRGYSDNSYTLASTAAMNGHADIIKAICNKNSHTITREQIAYLAAERGDENMIKTLYGINPDFLINVTEIAHKAARFDHFNIIKLLYDKKISFDIQNIAYTAVNYDHAADLIEKLANLDNNFKVNHIYEHYKLFPTLIHNATYKGHVNVLEKLYLLAEKSNEIDLFKKNCNLQNISGETPAFLAAKHGHVNFIKKLQSLFSDIDLNKANHSGMTPSTIAVTKNRIEVLKLFDDNILNTPIFMTAAQSKEIFYDIPNDGLIAFTLTDLAEKCKREGYPKCFNYLESKQIKPILSNHLLNNALVILKQNNTNTLNGNQIQINGELFNKLKDNHILQKAIVNANEMNIDYHIIRDILNIESLQKPLATLYETNITLNLQKYNIIADNNNVKNALVHAYDYLTSNKFGLFKNHGKKGQDATKVLVNHLLSLGNHPSDEAIQGLLGQWAEGSGTAETSRLAILSRSNTAPATPFHQQGSLPSNSSNQGCAIS